MAAINNFEKLYEEARKKANPAEKPELFRDLELKLRPERELVRVQRVKRSPGEEKFLSGERGCYKYEEKKGIVWQGHIKNDTL